MSATLAVDTVRISMELPCDHQFCAEHATKLYRLLNTRRYSESASVMDVPKSLPEWRTEHRTARKRAWRAERFGYWFEEVDLSDFSDDVYDINVSLKERQGRPMSEGYTTRKRQGRLSKDQTRCPRHRTHTYGVLDQGHLRVYLTLHRSGDLAMVSQILGHGDHLDNGIMYLLAAGLIEAQARQGGVFYYNRHDSGTEGLRWFKERLGFRPADIEWSLS